MAYINGAVFFAVNLDFCQGTSGLVCVRKSYVSVFVCGSLFLPQIPPWMDAFPIYFKYFRPTFIVIWALKYTSIQGFRRIWLMRIRSISYFADVDLNLFSKINSYKTFLILWLVKGIGWRIEGIFRLFIVSKRNPLYLFINCQSIHLICGFSNERWQKYSNLVLICFLHLCFNPTNSNIIVFYKICDKTFTRYRKLVSTHKRSSNLSWWWSCFKLNLNFLCYSCKAIWITISLNNVCSCCQIASLRLYLIVLTIDDLN